jgi:hypothetical protein
VVAQEQVGAQQVTLLMKEKMVTTLLPNNSNLQKKPNKTYMQSINYKMKFLPQNASFSQNNSKAFSMRTPTPSNTGSGPTKQSSAKVAEWPNVTPSPTFVYCQPTFTHSPAGKPKETNTFAQLLPHNHNSSPLECPSTTIKHPPFPQASQEPSSKIKFSFAISSSSR